jgi:Mu transposase, C-terminal domain
LTVKLYPDRIAIYFDAQLVARHTRSYYRHLDIEDPEHAKGLLAMLRFLALSPDAQASYDALVTG